jgi:D-aspartate ligase
MARADIANKPRAIVVGLDCITGLQTARILHRHQVPVVGVATRRSHWACSTNVCERIIEARTDSDELIAALADLGRTLDERAVIYACTDLSVLAVSKGRDRLANFFHIALPEHATVELLMDKVRFVQFAKQHDIAIPKTYLLKSSEDLRHAAEHLSYPCIMKPDIRSLQWESNAPGKVLRLESCEELISAYDEVAAYADVLIVQQWIDGTDADLFSCNCYFDSGSVPLASFVARKVRQWPPVTGISCLGEEVRNDVVRDETLKLFSKADYFGLGYVEMKRDSGSGKHYVIEPNIGRPTGRSAIAEAGNVELLYTMYCDLTGAPLPANREQRYTGVKWIYLRQDFRSALYYWRHGELTIAGWLKSLRGRKVYAVCSWTDPLPFFLDLYRALVKAFGSARQL